ncbi:MAG: alpha/beta hydrolase [Microbacteriaceae bacterium]|nr:alpha/beta hydrolase [Microbacteriaceae bacterium]
MTGLIPLDEVAADQRPLIEAFRAAGGKSFQDAESFEAVRESYEVSSAKNGLAPDEVAHVEDVEIGEGDERFAVRVYDPRESRSAEDAVLLFFHGGGWIIGSLDTHDPVCRRLATRTGLPVVAVDYRLGPEFPFPAGHLDCRRAVEWLRDEAGARGWDASRIVTVGDSAGGGLATVIAAEPSMRVEGTGFAAQVLLYPMVDVQNEAPSYERITEGFPLTAATIRWFAENLLADPADAADPRVSPLLGVEEGDAPQPPAWVLSLGLDPLGDEALDYATRIARNGTHVETVYLPNHAHGLFTAAGRIATGERMLDRAAEFILRFV